MELQIGITGGAGYIGSKLSQKFIQEGYKLKVIDSRPLPREQIFNTDKVEFIQGDLLSNKHLEKFVEGLSFIYHLAGMANVRDCSDDIRKSLELNVLSTRLILDKIKNKDILGFLFPSSIAALYGDLEYVPVDENHPIKPINDYGVLKRSSELFCQAFYRSYGTPIIIVRQSTIFGPSPVMKLDSVIHRFIDNVINGRNLIIFGTGNQKRNFLFIDDLIQFYFNIFIKARNNNSIKGEVFNLAGKEVVTIKDLARKVIKMGEDMLNKRVEIEYQRPTNEVIGRDLNISIDKAKKYLGYTPVYSLAEGLEKTFSYIYEASKKERMYLPARPLASRIS